MFSKAHLCVRGTSYNLTHEQGKSQPLIFLNKYERFILVNKQKESAQPLPILAHLSIIKHLLLYLIHLYNV